MSDPYKPQMPFGRHRGVPIDRVPKSYLIWCLDNINDLRPALRRVIESVVFADQQFEDGKKAGVRLAIDSIKNWHKQSAIKHHPDRGGDRKTMAIVTCLRDDLVTLLEGVLR